MLSEDTTPLEIEKKEEGTKKAETYAEELKQKKDKEAKERWERNHEHAAYVSLFMGG